MEIYPTQEELEAIADYAAQEAAAGATSAKEHSQIFRETVARRIIDRTLEQLRKQEPYAHEFGRSNGDGTFSVHIERGRPFDACADWKIKPLYAAPVPVPAPAVPEWQPIDTAPKDVEVFIGKFIDGEFIFGKSVCFYEQGNEFEGEYWHGWVWSTDDVRDSVAECPDYWMPLPQPPKEQV